MSRDLLQCEDDEDDVNDDDDDDAGRTLTGHSSSLSVTDLPVQDRCIDEDQLVETDDLSDQVERKLYS